MTLAALRDSGIAVALDDFGIDHTAFQLLQRLPLKAVKLDHSLLHAARHMSQARQAYAALVTLCLRLGFTVVAEGVETIEDARWLITLGIQQGQGYFFARPMELRDFVRRYGPGQRAGGGEFDVGALDYPAVEGRRRQVEKE